MSDGLRFKVITGLSGSGISTALKALEDLGYFCVDALPPELLPKLIELGNCAEKLRHLAIGLDARSVSDASSVVALLNKLRSEGHECDILFLEASDEVLLGRFSVTRRPHPAGRDLALPDAIRVERLAMAPFRAAATEILDTSSLNVHENRAAIQRFAGHENDGMRVSVLSFGYRNGVPLDANLVWDVRFLPNPFFVDDLRMLSGLDKPVRDYVLEKSETSAFLQHFLPLLDYVLPQYEREGKSYLTLAIGCTGGRHRSVVLAEEIAQRLQQKGVSVTVRHRDMKKEFS